MDINTEYLKKGKIKSSVFNRVTAYLDTGIINLLLQAGQFEHRVEEY